jgi:hypothetical protein
MKSNYVFVNGAWHTGKELERGGVDRYGRSSHVHADNHGQSFRRSENRWIGSIVDYLAENDLTNIILIAAAAGLVG